MKNAKKISIRSTLVPLGFLGTLLFASPAHCMCALPWFDGQWDCRIDGRPASMVWELVVGSETTCNGGICSTHETCTVQGWFRDNGGEAVLLKIGNRNDHQLLFTHTPDNTQWYLKQRGENPSAVSGYSTWQGKQYGLTCDKNLHGDVRVAESNGTSVFGGRSGKRHDWFCVDDEICETGDVNGDGRDDLIAFNRGNNGDVYVALANSSGNFDGLGQRWHDWFCVRDELCKVADVNGDGKDDVITFTRGTAGDVYVALSNGQNAFVGTGSKWHDKLCLDDQICETGDVNGDGRADVVAFSRGSAGDVFVALSNGTSRFSEKVMKWHDMFCVGDEVCKVGDANGDSQADVIAFNRGNAGDVYVALSNGKSGFVGTALKWHDMFCVGDEICLTGDVNGDGRDDLIALNRGNNGDVYVALSNGANGFQGTAQKWHDRFCFGEEVCRVGDVNADGRADLYSFHRDRN